MATLSKHWNGVSLIPDNEPTHSSVMDLYTDAGGLGYDGYYHGHWFKDKWTQDLQLDNDPQLFIAFQKLFVLS